MRRSLAALMIIAVCFPVHAAAPKKKSATPSKAVAPAKDPGPALTAPPGAVPAAESFTLRQCVDLAAQASEQLQIVREDYNRARALFNQARGAALPDIFFHYIHTLQDTSGVNTESGGVGGTLTRRDRDESRFSARQPIFSGLKEFWAMKGYGAEKRRQELLHRQAQLQLFSDVAQAFYTAVLNETDVRDLETILKLTTDRVDELKGRTELGKSRQSETLSADSQALALRAQIQQTRAQALSARDTLSYLTGRDMRAAILVDDLTPVTTLSPEEESLARADQRTDIRALEEEVEALKFRVRTVKGDYFPDAAVTGNYYTKRPGFQSEIDWDVVFNVDVPIFQGGFVKAQADEAMAVYRQGKLRLQQARRRVRSEILQARTALMASIDAASFYRAAYEKARRSYELQAREYRLGLVNNLDVLSALNAMQDAKQSYDRAVVQGKLDLVALQVATEDIQ